jgi:hypothetical protein
MVDPAGGAPDDATQGRTAGGIRGVLSSLAIAGFGGCALVIFSALLIGLMAGPWVAGGVFFYGAAQAAPAAKIYQEAPRCPAEGSSRSNCVQLVAGTITGINRLRGSRFSNTDDISVGLPTESQSVHITDLLALPSWLRVGQPVVVTLYQGSITQIADDGSQADTDDNPVVHEHDLLITGSMCMAFGLIFDGVIFTAVRRRKKGSGPLAS